MQRNLILAYGYAKLAFYGEKQFFIIATIKPLQFPLFLVDCLGFGKRCFPVIFLSFLRLKLFDGFADRRDIGK